MNKRAEYWEKRAKQLEKENSENQAFQGCLCLILMIIIFVLVCIYGCK